LKYTTHQTSTHQQIKHINTSPNQTHKTHQTSTHQHIINTSTHQHLKPSLPSVSTSPLGFVGLRLLWTWWARYFLGDSCGFRDVLTELSTPYISEGIYVCVSSSSAGATLSLRNLDQVSLSRL
jgi:hypothetical protein